MHCPLTTRPCLGLFRVEMEAIFRACGVKGLLRDATGWRRFFLDDFTLLVVYGSWNDGELFLFLVRPSLRPHVPPFFISCLSSGHPHAQWLHVLQGKG